MRRRGGSPALVAGLAAAAASMSCERPRPVPYAEARAVIDRRCVECHSERNSNRAFPIAPKGVMLDTAGQMRQYAGRIEARVVVERTMPIANLNNMTEEERAVLGRWVAGGAKIE